MVVAKSQPLDTSFDIVVSTRGGTRSEKAQPLCRRVLLPSNALLVHTDTTEDNSKTTYKQEFLILGLDLEIEVINPRVLWHPKYSMPCSFSHLLVQPR